MKKSTPVRFVGVDEAGYGPNLGPLVVACVAFEGPKRLAGRDWWAELAPAVGRDVDSRFPINDSKCLFSHPRGRPAVERTLAAAFHLLGRRPTSLESLFAAFAADSLADLAREHWYGVEKGWSELAFTDGLNDCLESLGLRLVFMEAAAIFPSRFNERVSQTQNKADVELPVVGELLRRAVVGAEPCFGGAFVKVDRLGGRKFYRPFLETVCGDAFVRTHRETARCSDYSFLHRDAVVEISFEANADSGCLPVALASMAAKYLREAVMAEFNAFWAALVPGVRPTAGYPGDASRFRRDVFHVWETFNRPVAEFWRER